MAAMMMMPLAAPTPMMAPPSSAPPGSLLRRHQTNPNPNPTSHHHHHRLYVGNIPWDATEEEIVDECSIFGRVISLKLVRDKDTGKHKGYGFIDFADDESALCAKRNQKGLLCRGRQLKVCDPIICKDNNNKKQQQQKPQPQNSQLPCAAVVNSSPPSNSDSFPVKRPHEEEADGEPQGSAHKRLHIDIQLPHPSHEDDDGKSQPAHVLDSGCPPSDSNSSNCAIKKRSHEASADDDESQQASAMKRPRIIHVQLPRSAPHPSESADYVEPYSPTSPGFVWPRNGRNMDQEGLHAHEMSQEEQMKQPTVIDHIDFASALSCATAGSADVLVSDQGFINDLLNLSSLLRSACI